MFFHGLFKQIKSIVSIISILIGLKLNLYRLFCIVHVLVHVLRVLFSMSTTDSILVPIVTK